MGRQPTVTASGRNRRSGPHGSPAARVSDVASSTAAPIARTGRARSRCGSEPIPVGDWTDLGDGEAANGLSSEWSAPAAEGCTGDAGAARWSCTCTDAQAQAAACAAFTVRQAPRPQLIPSPPPGFAHTHNATFTSTAPRSPKIPAEAIPVSIRKTRLRQRLRRTPGCSLRGSHRLPRDRTHVVGGFPIHDHLRHGRPYDHHQARRQQCFD